MADQYKTIDAPASARFTEKMSRFLAFIHPVKNAEDARALVKDYTSRYHDSRHVCWAYMLGPGRTEWQLTDNGEPSGTAGRPILGQINSAELTDVIIIVVRYFGGIKLGTPGLIAAYKEAARLAIGSATIIECFDMVAINITFPYETMNPVMKLVKQSGVKVKSQNFDNKCSMTLEIRRDQSETLIQQLNNIDYVHAETD